MQDQVVVGSAIHAVKKLDSAMHEHVPLVDVLAGLVVVVQSDLFHPEVQSGPSNRICFSASNTLQH